MSGVLSTLGWLALVVVVGSTVPVLPTGAAVSAAAALMFHQHPVLVPLVVLAGAAGAYVGDIATFAAARWGNEKVVRRLGWKRDGRLLDRLADQLRANDLAVLLVSRLLPAGRIPVLLAAAATRMPWRRFLIVNGPACALWSAVYATVGLLSGSLFDEPWQSVLAAVVLVLLITRVVVSARRRSTRASAPVVSDPGAVRESVAPIDEQPV